MYCGCKYGDENCTVTQRLLPQSTVTENCEWAREEYEVDAYVEDRELVLAELAAAKLEIERLRGWLRDAAVDLSECAEFIRTLPKDLPGGYNTRIKASSTAQFIEEQLGGVA